MTFGPVELRDFGSPAETVITYPHPSYRLVNGVPSYLHRDEQGSIRSITSETGAEVEDRFYLPYGGIAETNSSPVVTPETKGWIGERYDAGAGLQYLNARYYDPAIGLFLQPDWFEVTEPGVGTNRYAYSAGDPVNRLDPSGNKSWIKKAGEAVVEAFTGRGNREAAQEAAERSIRNGVSRLRNQARDEAWREEIELVQKTGRGSRDWEPDELERLKRGERLSDVYDGHHINNVASRPDLAGDPNNIKFVRRGPEHSAQHPGGTRNPTSGPLIDRSAILAEEGFEMSTSTKPLASWDDVVSGATRAARPRFERTLSLLEAIPDPLSMYLDYRHQISPQGRADRMLRDCGAGILDCS